MKIQGETTIITMSEEMPVKEPALVAKRFAELAAGDSFKALVLNIKPGYVTIKLSNGENLTARSLALPDVRIGDETIFTVKESSKGQIFLEMFKPGIDLTQNKLAKDALNNAKIYPSEDNLATAKVLMDHNMPIDESILEKALYFKHIGNLEMDKIIFLIKENFPTHENNISILNGLLDKTLKFENNLMALAERLITLPETGENLEIVEKFMETLKIPFRHRPLAQVISELKNRVFTDIRRGELQGLKTLYNELHTASSNAAELIQERGGDPELGRIFSNIRDCLEFMDYINNYKQYLQIPFSLDGITHNAELFVFKDARSAKRNNGAASVLIGLDLHRLGRVEAFIVKDNNVLNFQFRTDRKGTMKLISKKFGGLQDELRTKGFLISGVSYKKIDEAFTVINDEKDLRETEANTKKHRYSFDMRV